MLAVRTVAALVVVPVWFTLLFYELGVLPGMVHYVSQGLHRRTSPLFSKEDLPLQVVASLATMPKDSPLEQEWSPSPSIADSGTYARSVSSPIVPFWSSPDSGSKPPELMPGSIEPTPPQEGGYVGRFGWLLLGSTLMGFNGYFPHFVGPSSFLRPVRAALPALCWAASWWFSPPGWEPGFLNLAPLSHT